MNHPAAQQILYAYKELEITPEIIANQFEVSLATVQSIIAKEDGVKTLLEKGIENGDDIIELLKNLAFHGESDKVKLDALKYLHAEQKGRNDIPLQNLELKRQKLALESINVASNLAKFNESLRRSRELQTTGRGLPKLVEVGQPT